MTDQATKLRLAFATIDVTPDPIADDRFSELPDVEKNRIAQDYAAALDDDADPAWLKFRDAEVTKWFNRQHALTGERRHR